MNSTIAEVAQVFDTTEEVITDLVPQIWNDAQLWDAETRTLTNAGMEVLREVIQNEDPGDSTLDDVADAAEAYREASEVLDDVRGQLHKAIRAAVRYGHPKSHVAAAANISRELLYRIIN